MKIIAVSILTIFILTNNIYSQCCAAGNPICSDDNQNEGKNTIKVSTLYLHSFSDTYFEGSQISDFKYKNTYFDFSLFSISYGLSKKLSFKGELGYFFNKSEYFVFTDITRHAYGVSDAALTARYRTFSFSKQNLKIDNSFMLKIPIGVFDQVQNNIILPIDLQPSSGSYRYTPGVNIYKRFSNPKFLLSVTALAEFAQAIRTERTINYKYGNLYLFSVMGSYKIRKWLGLTIQIKEMIREKASNNGSIMQATGGNIVFLVPQVQTTYKDWQFSVMLDKPIYKNLNSPDYPQLSNKYAISLNLSYTLDMNKDKQEVLGNRTENFKQQTFFVDGVCNMCKERILKVSYKSKNIKWAEWDIQNKILTVKYKNKIDLIKLKNDLASAGHDTDEIKAPDNVYNELHHCCKYRTE